MYLKDLKIHTVIYDVEFNPKRPANMEEIEVKSNQDYIQAQRLYPETCDYHFCRILGRCGVDLPFTDFNEDRPVADFYGFTLED